MKKLLLLAAVSLPLVACTTHDRVFYNNRPHKGHGLDVTGPAPAPEVVAPALGEVPAPTAPAPVAPAPALPE